MKTIAALWTHPVVRVYAWLILGVAIVMVASYAVLSSLRPDRPFSFRASHVAQNGAVKVASASRDEGKISFARTAWTLVVDQVSNSPFIVRVPIPRSDCAGIVEGSGLSCQDGEIELPAADTVSFEWRNGAARLDPSPIRVSSATLRFSSTGTDPPSASSAIDVVLVGTQVELCFTTAPPSGLDVRVGRHWLRWTGGSAPTSLTCGEGVSFIVPASVAYGPNEETSVTLTLHSDELDAEVTGRTVRSTLGPGLVRIGAVERSVSESEVLNAAGRAVTATLHLRADPSAELSGTADTVLVTSELNQSWLEEHSTLWQMFFALLMAALFGGILLDLFRAKGGER